MFLKNIIIDKDIVNSTSFNNTSLKPNDAKEIIYKTTNNIPLTLDLYEPN